MQLLQLLKSVFLFLRKNPDYSSHALSLLMIFWYKYNVQCMQTPFWLKPLLIGFYKRNDIFGVILRQDIREINSGVIKKLWNIFHIMSLHFFSFSQTIRSCFVSVAMLWAENEWALTFVNSEKLQKLKVRKSVSRYVGRFSRGRKDGDGEIFYRWENITFMSHSFPF